MSGELKASQHLGLARLTSQQYDRVERLSLPQDTNILSFNRRRLFNAQQQQRDTCTNTVDDVGETECYFNRWLFSQGITTDNDERAVQWRDGAEEISAIPAAGLVVAYGSYDYRDHAMGYLTRGIFCNHQARKVVALLRVTYVSLSPRYLRVYFVLKMLPLGKRHKQIPPRKCGHLRLS